MPGIGDLGVTPQAVFKIDIETCRECGCFVKVIACIDQLGDGQEAIIAIITGVVWVQKTPSDPENGQSEAERARK